MMQASILLAMDSTDGTTGTIDGTDAQLATLLDCTANAHPRFRKVLMAVASKQSVDQLQELEMSEAAMHVCENMKSVKQINK